MRYLFFLNILFLFSISSAQVSSPTIIEDSLYLEDQFYVGITYNLLLDKPNNVTQRNLSYGLHGGFIKDIPLNSKRTIALGLGLGYGVNSYYSNLQAREVMDGFEYTVLDNDSDVTFKRNKIETHLIEMPLEFRWRNSNPSSYKFWRVYTGVKLAYVVGSRSKFISDDIRSSFYNTDTRNFQYGVMLNFGYNTFNIHAYYALNDLFEDGVATDTGDPITIRPLRIGLIFYIL